ncbi:GDSL-like lipase/acylhydrolase [Penicillium samsonianum]|uniref:GDSL-like lipase/acylhydrolase n=1 Tax=Penicillium samsonianum TaxID=1882272 RepID=UPI00254763DC|nr:GDSL-like lipase/acylhydrolase [Penicillium samsonianum]KAJ6126212.1 GDSL-like lipase/acylhydrolase [Penicillium samsonianum]
MTSVSGLSAERYEEMAEKLSLLCFGGSLTAGYYSYGLEHPYAGKLKESLEAAFPNIEITVDVDGEG